MSSDHSTTKLGRWAIRAAVGLLALLLALILAAWVALRWLDLDAISARVKMAVGEATGRTFTMGRPEVRLLPQPNVVIRDIALANPPGASRAQMLVVARVSVGISLAAVLRGRGLGARVEVSGADLLLERDEKGAGNWTLVVPARDLLRNLVEALGVVAEYAKFDTVTISDTFIGFSDQLERTHGLRVKQASAVIADDALDLELEADAGGEVVSATGSVGLAPVKGGGLPLKVEFSAPGTRATAAGRVAPNWPADGTEVQIDITIDDAQRLAAAAGLSIPQTPSLSLSAKLLGRERKLRAEPLRLAIGASRVDGFIELSEGRSRPSISARLEAPMIDLSQPTETTAPPTQDEPRPSSDGRLIGDLPLAFPQLRLFDGTLGLAVKRLVLPGGTDLADFAAKLSLAGGRLTADPLAVGAADSRISGRLVLDASSAGSTGVETQVRANGVSLEALLPRDLGVSGGSADAEISVSARGASLRPLLGSLNGGVRVVVREARISGALARLGGSLLGEIVGTLNPFARADKTMQLKCAVVNVPLRNGVLATKDGIGIETDKLVAKVSGQVDFGKETLDLRLHSEAVDALGPGLADFAGAGRVTGTFAEPKVELSAQGAAKLGVHAGVAAATGGVSLLLGSLLRAAIPAHPCKTALQASE